MAKITVFLGVDGFMVENKIYFISVLFIKEKGLNSYTLRM